MYVALPHLGAMEAYNSDTNDRTPFLRIIEQARQIQVNELPYRDETFIVHSVRKALNRSNTNPGAAQLFLVKVEKNSQSIFQGYPSLEATHPDYLLKCGKLLLSGDETLLAKHIFSFLLKKDLRNREALLGLGRCFFKLGEITSARRCFTALWEFHQESDAHLWIGRCHIADGRNDLALRCYQRVESSKLIDDERSSYHKELGNLFAREGEFENALVAYEKALELNPKSDLLFTNIGTVNVQQGRYEVAKRAFVKALELNPSNPKATSGLGCVEKLTGQLKAAWQYFLKAMELDPQNLIAVHELAALAEGHEAIVEANKKVVLFLQKDPKNLDVLFLQAGLRFRDSDWSGAEEVLDKILEGMPNHSKARDLKDQIVNLRRIV